MIIIVRYSSSVLDPYHGDNRKRDLKKIKSGRRESAMDTDEWVEKVQSLLRKQCLSKHMFQPRNILTTNNGQK
jgi:hypothetical protein